MGSAWSCSREDGIGDDDGLCESDEHCTCSPNFGAWQGGPGTQGQPCIFDDAQGSVRGVTIFAPGE